MKQSLKTIPIIYLFQARGLSVTGDSWEQFSDRDVAVLVHLSDSEREQAQSVPVWPLLFPVVCGWLSLS